MRVAFDENYNIFSIYDKVSGHEAVKEAEDGSEVIVRLYDAYGTRTKAKVSFGFDVAKVESASILEEAEEEIPVADNTVTLSVKPFEIVTLKVTRKI
ncbi:MAG: hypothetical protein HDR26_09245 [Lachnospiraceae bacterium]|nr:hypothetical protein [Lachnospiraceae bacterium]